MAFSLAWISFSWFWYMFSWWLSLAYFSLISVSSTTPNASSAHACIEIKDVLGHQETALHLLRGNSTPTKFAHNIKKIRLQNSPYFCVFKYARAVKQKVWNEAENRERDWGETLKICFFFLSRACKARALRARKTLTPRFTNFFTDFEKNTDCFAV